jgi:hypothetical protein
VFASPAVAVLPAVIAAQKDSLGLGGLLTLLLFALLAALPPALLLLGAWVQGGPRMLAERRWVERLPFPLERHLETLGAFDDHGGAAGVYRSATLHVELVGDESIEELADACRGFDDQLAVKTSRGRIELTRDEMVGRDGSNHRYYVWAHQMVDGLLVPLSSQRRIGRVLVETSHVGRPASGPEWSELQ